MEIALSKTVHFWQEEITLYERAFEKWTKRGKKILKRYKDQRSPREEAVTRFNVLWSNIQTRLPALYARDPKPEVERRFKDRDPVGRVTSEILERSIDYTIRHCNPFGRIIRQAVLDYELPGRGTVWVRYVPHFHKAELEPDAVEDNEEVKAEGHQVTDDAEEEPREELGYEETIIDYVAWEDYGHTYARTEEEVRAKWRRVYLSRDELAERFELDEDELSAIPMEWTPKTLNDTKLRPEQKKAIVYEIWDKQERKALWIVKNYPDPLDEIDDPLGLEGFFPTPCPLYANLTPDELIPTPNFTYYQDQASEIDELSTRIAAIGKALKVAGVRDTSAEGLDRLLSEGVENQLIPVDGWIALKEKGGLAGVMELLPLKEIAEALGYLREQRQQLIDDIYQITGLSDIIRGLSDPNETATAQQIKGQFSVLRISDAQTEVQRFCRDVIRICAEIIAGYDLNTLKQISGVKLLTNAEKEQISAQLAAIQHPMPQMPGGMAPGGGPAPGAGAPGPVPGSPPAGGQVPAGGALPMPAQAAPGGGPQGGAAAPAPAAGSPQGPPPEILKLLKEPSWEDVAGLLKNKVLREFRIDIETDSTIRMDEEAEKEARMEFLDRATNFITVAATAPPPMIPAIGEVFLFAVRGFKVARNLERTFEDALEELKHQPPRPDPEMMKVQAQVEGQKAIAQMKSQADMQVEQHKQEMQAKENALQNQFEDSRKQRELAATNAHEAQLEQMRQEFEGQKVAIEKASAERIAAAKNATDLEIARMNHAHEQAMKGAEQQHEAAITQLNQSHERTMAEHQAKTGETAERVKGEEARKTEAVRGETSRETEKVKGDQAERIAKVKPKAEAEAAAQGKKDEQKPVTDVLEKLEKAVKDLRRPRKFIKNPDGTVEIH